MALALGGASFADAAPSPITGTLDRPGYTVIALASTNEVTVLATSGGFSLVPPATVVTLHLRAPDGTYGGPIMLAEGWDRVKVARAQVTSAEKKVKAAKTTVTRSQKRVVQAKRAVVRAQRKLKHAHGSRARRRATAALKRTKSQLKKTNTQLKKARAQLKTANTRLAAAKRQLTDAQKQVATRTQWAVLGVKAGASLGQIRVNSAGGYAVAGLSERAWTSWVDTTRTARASNRVPIGAGNFGRVISPPAPGKVLGDTDLDGIPDLLDIDVNGNLILNELDRSTTARAAAVTDRFFLASDLITTIDWTANANATGVTVQDTDAALAHDGRLIMGIIPGESPELDCGQPQSRTDPGLGGLVYCTKGGTGQHFAPGAAVVFTPFPDAYDPDNDGFGTLTPSNPQPAPGSGQMGMFLFHGATSAQIGTGDLLIQRVIQDGVEHEYPATIEYIFDTVPALVSYDDGQGNAVTVPYPVKKPDGGPGGPGTRENPFSVSAGADGNVVVTFTFWRPQRKPIPPETGSWIDIGRLNYSVGVGTGGGGCPQDAFSTSDPNLRPLETADVFPASYYGLKDLAADRPASPVNTFTFTLNLTRCATAAGSTFNQGETRRITLNASPPAGAGSVAQQELSFTRQ